MSQAVVSSEKIKSLAQALDKMKANIAGVATKHLNPEKMVKLALANASRNPLLLQCTPQSILLCVMNASQLGLEPDGLLGQAYLVPYKNNKTGTYEATFIVGYRGLLELARRSGQIETIEAHLVYDSDEFHCEYGLEPKLIHIPSFAKDRGNIRAVYAVARFKEGGHQAEVMTLDEINAIRSRSKSGNYGPWASDFGEMAKKTVLRKLCKTLPLTTEAARVAAADGALEAGEITAVVDHEVVAALEESSEPAEPKSRVSALLEKLGE